MSCFCQKANMSSVAPMMSSEPTVKRHHKEPPQPRPLQPKKPESSPRKPRDKSPKKKPLRRKYASRDLLSKSKKKVAPYDPRNQPDDVRTKKVKKGNRIKEARAEFIKRISSPVRKAAQKWKEKYENRLWS